MSKHDSVILSEAKDPMHARSASGNAGNSRDAEDFASKPPNDVWNITAYS